MHAQPAVSKVRSLVGARQSPVDRVVRIAARAGLAARGVLYAVVGMLAAQVASGPAEADRQGALEAVGDRPFGQMLLVLLGVGFAALAGWRILQAVHGDPYEARTPPKRAAMAAHAIVYGLLAVATVMLLAGRRGEEGDRETQELTATVLRWPAGQLLVTAAGLAILAVAGYQARQVWRRRYVERLDTGAMTTGVEHAVLVVGGLGHAARALVFVLLGTFVIQAAVRFDPNEAKGLDGALREVAGTAAGTVVLSFVAAGLIAFGLYCFAEARYRALPRPA